MASVSCSMFAPLGFQPFDSLVPVWELFGDVATWKTRYSNPLDRRSRTEHEVTWFVHDVSKWSADIFEMFPYASVSLMEYGHAFSAVRATIDDDDVATIANQLAMDAFWAARPGLTK